MRTLLQVCYVHIHIESRLSKSILMHKIQIVFNYTYYHLFFSSFFDTKAQSIFLIELDEMKRKPNYNSIKILVKIGKFWKILSFFHSIADSQKPNKKNFRQKINWVLDGFIHKISESKILF